jgi:hypothetical protein
MMIAVVGVCISSVLVVLPLARSRMLDSLVPTRMLIEWQRFETGNGSWATGVLSDRRLSPAQRDLYLTILSRRLANSFQASSRNSAGRSLADLSHSSPFSNTVCSLLESNLQHEDDNVRFWSAVVLSGPYQQSQRAVPVLLEATEAWGYRIHAIENLEFIEPDENVIAHMRKLLLEEDEEIVWRTAKEAGHIGPAASALVPELVIALNSDESLEAGLEWIIYAIREMGPAGTVALPRLRELADDPNVPSGVVRQARRAIESLESDH